MTTLLIHPWCCCLYFTCCDCAVRRNFALAVHSYAVGSNVEHAIRLCEFELTIACGLMWHSTPTTSVQGCCGSTVQRSTLLFEQRGVQSRNHTLLLTA